MGRVIALISIMSFAMAATGYAADGTVYGCYQNTTGILRIVSVSTQCRQGETPLQLASPAALPKVISGTVVGDGTTVRGTGFTSEHTGTGAYQITFDTAFDTEPTCTLSTLYLAPTVVDVCVVASVYASALDVVCDYIFYDEGSDKTSGPIINDANFSFICVQ